MTPEERRAQVEKAICKIIQAHRLTWKDIRPPRTFGDCKRDLVKAIFALRDPDGQPMMCIADIARNQRDHDAAHYEPEIRRLEAQIQRYKEIREYCLDRVGAMVSEARTATAREITTYLRACGNAALSVAAECIETKYGLTILPEAPK